MPNSCCVHKISPVQERHAEYDSMPIVKEPHHFLTSPQSRFACKGMIFSHQKAKWCNGSTPDSIATREREPRRVSDFPTHPSSSQDPGVGKIWRSIFESWFRRLWFFVPFGLCDWVSFWTWCCGCGFCYWADLIWQAKRLVLIRT